MKSALPLALAALCLHTTTQAATFTVTTLADSGPGSLRSAVAAANATPGTDIIRFQAGLAGTVQLAGAITVSDDLDVQGPGPALLTLSGSPASHILTLAGTSTSRPAIKLSGLTMAHGRGENGGAVDGQYVDLTIRNAVLRDNAATNRGGAIHLGRGDLTLHDVDLANNAATSSGGAVYYFAGRFDMKRSSVRDNDGLYGGGIYFGGPPPSVRIEDSVFSGNVTTYTGGAISAGYDMPAFHVTRSSFLNNSSGQPTGAAIVLGWAGSGPDATPTVIENSTFSGNYTDHSNGRGIIVVNGGTLNLRNSTVADNHTALNMHTPAPGEGGAVWIGNARVNIVSTLFWNNTHGAALVDLGPSSHPGAIFNVSHSLLHSSPEAGLINGTNVGNQFATNALLQPLVNAGAAGTPVHPIPAYSPAVDAGSNPAGLATDQRGHARTVDLIPCRSPQLARTDVGAYELGGDTIFCHGFER